MMVAAPVEGYEVTLGYLLAGFVSPGPWASTPVSGIAIDSRRVVAGALFLACPGGRGHGADHIGQALEYGAAAVLYDPERWQGEPPAEGWAALVIRLPSLAGHMAEITARFFDHPSRKLNLIGVTGTNGKTSVSYYVAQVLNLRGVCGLIGTLGYGLLGALDDSVERTTPDTVVVQSELAAMVEAGAKYAVMEVSSHGLDQGRVDALCFGVAAFTNLTLDHTDYHGDMASYAAAKRQLFRWPGLKAAVVNLDDSYGREWLGSLPEGCSAIGYSLQGGSVAAGVKVISCQALIMDDEGITLKIHSPFGSATLRSQLLGRFNAANLLAALGVLLAVGVGFDEAVAGLSGIEMAPGRMERFGGEGQPMVVVDYAHTPDALEQVLRGLADHCKGELWCVFGCGGDRDRLKRPLMGRLAEELADRVVLTSDNPRGEDPFTILEGITRGMRNPDAAYVIADRAEAIRQTISLACSDDLVVVAGKGDERKQWLGQRAIPFCDADEVIKALGGEVADGR